MELLQMHIEDSVADRAENLVQALKEQKDAIVFEKLYRLYEKKVLAKCWYYVKDKGEAAEIADSVWMQVWSKIDQFKSESGFGTWLYRICSNECLNYLKVRSTNALRFSSLDEEDFSEQVSENERESIEREFDKLDVSAALLKLPKEARALVMLKHYDNYTYDEIAAKTGLSASAVKMTISRAKKKMLQWV